MKNKLLTVLLYLSCGALCALPAVIGELWILGWIGFVPILICEYVRKADEKRPYFKAWKRGFLFFYAYGLVTFYWFIELYPLDFAGFTPAAALGVVLLAWLGIPLLQCLTSSFVTVLLCFFARKRAPLGLYPIFSGLVWVVHEWMHTQTWAGVPWGKLAVGQTARLENIQSASLLGSYFVAFIMICTAGIIALSIIQIGKKETARRGILCLICAVMIFEANSIYGHIALNSETTSDHRLTAAAIQANISSDEKWNSDGMMSYESYRQLTLDAANEGAVLIVWPETALPYRLMDDDWLTAYVYDIAAEADASIIVGCFRQEGDEMYNAVEFVSPDDGYADNFYAKRRLVPFGEFVPLRDLVMTVFPPLADVSMLSDDLTSGESSSLFETQYGKIGSLICIDSIYETLALQSVRDGAELLCISTNDSWFHDSSAAYEHNSQAILRSIETGRYTVRAANTGVSSIITNKGETVDMYPVLERGFAIGEIEFISDNTLYTHLGNVLVYFSIIFIILFIGFYIIRSIKNGHTHR